MSHLRLLIFALATLSLDLTPSLNAAVMERDFLATGDGLLTYDDVNQREWLDLSETEDMTPEELSVALSENGLLRGFRVATLGDVEGLAESAGVPWGTFILPGLAGPGAYEFVSLVGDYPPQNSNDIADDIDGEGYPGGYTAYTYAELEYGVYPGYRPVNYYINSAPPTSAYDFDDFVILPVTSTILGLRVANGIIASSSSPDGQGQLDFSSRESVYAFSIGDPIIPGSLNPLLIAPDVNGNMVLDTLGEDAPVVGPFWLFRGVPEPSTLALFAIGLAATFCQRNRLG